MKKTLSLVLTMCMVLSLFATFAITASADEAVNLAAGKEVANQENVEASITELWINTDLTDGVVDASPDFANGIKWTPGQWFGYWYNADSEKTPNAPEGVAIPTINLGGSYNIESARVHVYLGSDYAGIVAPKSVSLLVSDDGVTFTQVGTTAVTAQEGTVAQGWVEVVPESAVTATYVRVAMELGGYWLFIDELEVYGTEASAVVEDKVINLLAQGTNVECNNLTYEANGETVNDNIVYTLDENGFNVSHTAGQWPYATLLFDSLVTVPVEGTYVELEATVTGEGYGAAIRLIGPIDDTSAAASDAIYLHQFDEDVAIDGSGDAPIGSVISFKLPLSELAYCNYVAEEGYAGKIPFTTDELSFKGLRVVVSGSGAVCTVTKLNLIVPGTPSVPVIKEEITVDGEVNDTGWAKNGWINVSGENGFWQYPTPKEAAEGTPIPTFTYKFQLRADDTKLYGALVLDGVHEEDKNIKVRVWFRDNDEATVYTSFYDFVLAPDGTLTTLGKYNQALDDNKGCFIGQTDPTVQEYIGSLDAKAVAADGKTVFEFSVDIDEVTADGNFDYFVCLERKQGVNTGTLYYPAVPAGPETAPHANLPWLLWYAETDATVNVEDIVLGEIVVSDKEEADTSMMGTAPAAPAFTVTLNTAEGWVAGEKLVVTATVDILEDIDLSQVMFNLYYDASDVEIVLPEDLGAIITTGKDSWKEDSLFTLKTEGDYGVIECAPATTVEEDVLKKGEQLVMTFEFTVKAEAEGLINFQLSNKGLVGYSWDLTAAEAAGAGSSLAVENADELGDTGIYVIAALALVALIGTAVVIKKRA